MYAVANMIYGYPLVSSKSPSPRKRFPRLDAAVDEERKGFFTYYSGSSDDTPAGFGIDLGGFDEACAFVPASDIPAAPTPEQQAQFQALFDALDPDLQADLRALGEPSTFLLWSTS